MPHCWGWRPSCTGIVSIIVISRSSPGQHSISPHRFSSLQSGCVTGRPIPVLLSRGIRLFIAAIGVITLAVSLLLFLQPILMIRLWPWMLTPLTARVVGAMFALPAVVGLGIALEKRWSAARIILEAQAFSIVMILIATARAWSDFGQSKLITWLFVGGLSCLLVALAALYLSIKIHRRNAVKGHSLHA